MRKRKEEERIKLQDHPLTLLSLMEFNFQLAKGNRGKHHYKIQLKNKSRISMSSFAYSVGIPW